MKLQKPTPEQVRKARKMKYKGKAPKKPKKNSTTDALKKYIDRHNEWASKIRAAAKRYDERERVKKTIW